ncbi:F-box/kelch-repeat protein [Nymphaea thermarum]|nr:F-box/kelch-repeat protein [Nymphaea thermarum]
MDPSIWSQLPIELLEHVLARLPPHFFLLLRPTCRHFSTLHLSPSFLSLHSPFKAFSPPFSTPYLLLSHPLFHPNLHLYDFLHDQWRSISLPFPSSLSILSASSGLILFKVHKSPCLVIYNPLTKSCRSLRFSDGASVSHASIAASQPSDYDIVATNSSAAFYIYSSRRRRWSWIQPPDGSPLKNGKQEPVFCNSTFYIIGSDQFSVMGYRAESGKWGRVAPELPASLVFLRLASCQGKLYVVGGMGENGICRSLGVWEVEEEGGEVVELQRLPESMCRKLVGLCYHNYELIHCVGHGDLVCVYSSIAPQAMEVQDVRHTMISIEAYRIHISTGKARECSSSKAHPDLLRM